MDTRRSESQIEGGVDDIMQCDIMNTHIVIMILTLELGYVQTII